MTEVVSRETLLKRKMSCPSCGRVASAKYLAARHRCEMRPRGGPPGQKRRPRTEAEVEAWAAKVQDRTVQAFLKRIEQKATEADADVNTTSVDADVPAKSDDVESQ